MKKGLLIVSMLLLTGFIYGQTTYYWVGGTTPSTSINTGSNWNTSLNGSGSSRPSSTGAGDVLIFDGTNVGGSTPATGAVTVLVNGSITCAQIKLVNNASISFIRSSTGTGTITLAGGVGDDFVMEAGTALNFTSTVGSVRMAMDPSCTGLVSGAITMITPLQARFDNTTAGNPGSFIFTSGASLTTNITSSSSSYAFGSSTQSSDKWVVFQSGSHLYYAGGFSPHGSGSGFSAIDMRPGSIWHQRATNPSSGAGNFFNRVSYGDIIVENNADAIAFGTIYRIGNLTINTGSSFTTYSSGQTVITGDLTVNGSFLSDAASSNEVILAGNTAQSVSGSGTIDIASLIVADNANVTLNKSMAVQSSADIRGRINFKNNKITGAGTFSGIGPASGINGTGNLVAGAFMITGNTGITTNTRGMSVSGTGIAPNTAILAFSSTTDTIYISHALLASGSNVALSASSGGATLQTASTNGFDPASGSAALTGNQLYQNGLNYIIDGATTWPFGISTSASGTPIDAAFVEINAPVTLNRPVTISNHLMLNGKLTLRSSDNIHLLSGAILNGTPGATNYIATTGNSTTGEQSYLQYDGLASSMTLPIGSSGYYLPVTLGPAASSDFKVYVFEGITTNGLINGTALTALQKQTVVDAVWNISRLSGSGSCNLQLNWDAALEGSTFTTLPNTDIGLITNTGSSWALPIGTADNTANTTTANVSAFGAFSAGAVPQVDPFVFNSIPAKTYGDADFNGGATSLNTTQPIVYSSNNPAVATIVGGNIHITGAGTAMITASQATDGFYPPASVSQQLTVNKAALTIKADDKLKFEGQANPALTVTYTGFVLGETSTALLTQPNITTTATTGSAPGTYPITVNGATAANYDITFVNGVLTVQAKQNQTITFNALAAKTYGNADFNLTASSTNSTIPITFSSSNTSVATVTGNTVHIAGGGTTTITASQAGNAGYFAATDVPRTLTVNKAALTIRVLDTVKNEGQANPPFTITYTGFVLGETAANLATQPTVNTIATTASPAGLYALTPEGAVSDNYSFTYTAGKLTILPPGGTSENHIHAFMSSSTMLTVRVYSTFPALSDIRLYDLNGKPLLKKNVFLPQGFIEANVNVSQIPSGIYVVTVTGSGIDLKKTIPIIK